MLKSTPRLSLILFTMTFGWVHSEEPKLEPVIRSGHTGEILAVAVSSDGKWLLTGSTDRTAILWDVATGFKLQTFSGHETGVKAVALSANKKRALLGSHDQTASLWDVATGKKLMHFTGHKNLTRPAMIYAVALSADGERAVTGSYDESAIVWDCSTGKRIQTIKNSKHINSVAISPDGKRVLTPEQMWNAETGELHSLNAAEHIGPIVTVSFSGDGSRMLTGSSGVVVLQDTFTSKTLWAKKLPSSISVSLALTEKGDRAITAHELGNQVDFWDTRTGVAISTYRFDYNQDFKVSLSADGKVAALGLRHQVVLWEPETNRQIRVIDPAPNVYSVSVSDDDKQLLIAAGWTANLWNCQTGQKINTLAEHEGPVYSAAQSVDGRWVLTGSEDKSAILWDSTTGKKQTVLAQHSGPVHSVVLSPDGRSALSHSSKDEPLGFGNGGAKKNVVKRWNAQTGQVIGNLEKALEWDGDLVAFLSEDDQWFSVLRHKERITLSDVGSGKVIFDDKDSYSTPNRPISLSRNGKQLMYANFVYDVGTQKKTFRQSAPGSFDTCTRFSSNGTWAVAGRDDGGAAAWEAATGKLIQTFAGHTDRVRSVAITSGGRRLVTGSLDGTTRIWDVDTGKELCRIVTFNVGKDWLAVTPEGLFDGSVNGPQALSYRISGTLDFVPLDRFKNKYYKPGLIGLLMHGTPPVPAIPIAQALPPRVRIVEPVKSGIASDKTTLQISALAESQGKHPVTAFRLLLDGRPVANAIQRVAEPKMGEVKAEWNIFLKPGTHTVKVLADNELTQGFSEEIEVTRHDPASEIQLPSLYVFAVGVSRYPGALRLNYAHKDAEDLTRAYQTHGQKLYRKIEVKLLTDEKATRSAILDGLSWLEKNVTSRDFAVFFFAGHGEKNNNGRLFFLPVDVDIDNLSRSAVSAADLKETLAAIPCRLTCILDACHAGGIDSDKKRGGRTVTDDLMRDLIAEENGLVVMCSATGREFALESNEHRQGMFTLALLEGLAGKADANRDGVVYLHELENYVLERVRELSGGRQHPVTGKPTTVRSFPITQQK